MKRQLSNLLWLIRFCIRTSPKLFFFNIFACAEQSLFVFFEYTIWIGYNLDAAENGAPFSQVALLTLGVFALFVVHQFIDSIYFQWSFERLKPSLTFRLRRQIYEKARRVDLSCYDDVAFYNDFVLSTTQTDECVERFMNDGRDFISELVNAAAYFSYLLAADRIGLLLAVACSAVNYFSSKRYARLEKEARLCKTPIERERAYQHRVFYLHDFAKELRLHPGMRSRLSEDFDLCSQKLNTVNRKYGPKLWLYGFLKGYVPIYFMLYAVYLPYLLYRAMVTHTLSLSAMVILLAAVRRMVKRAGALFGRLPRFAYIGAFIERIRCFLDYEPKIVSGEIDVADDWNRLTLSHVNFSYPGSDTIAREVLRDISLEITQGQKIALVGYNGAGKTTLVKLLMRFYDPDSGVILRNGTDIRTLKLDAYRKEIGAVFQDYKIYAATLRENVVMDICTMERQETYAVEQALHRAKFNLAAQKLKYQVDTPLTTEFEKDGINLSGGESQKVAIARTLYRAHELIIMDEPSSALDPASEYQLNQELKQLAEDKTVIFISHRLATAKDADCIYMMKDGRIAEHGTHEQLLQLGGEYCKMWNLQAQAYQ
ncbi:MAG: ABC transporter ATP-binding protein/permease [Lachnospiraceae bacterium]|nr:ABC transporter ATP-binding protein/permease [Lachnospiraceae bacterium]